MELPNPSSLYVKVAIVVMCLVVIATLKYGLKWNDPTTSRGQIEELVETEAENIIKAEIGTNIDLPKI